MGLVIGRSCELHPPSAPLSDVISYTKDLTRFNKLSFSRAPFHAVPAYVTNLNPRNQSY